jgi:hypothetical protein
MRKRYIGATYIGATYIGATWEGKGRQGPAGGKAPSRRKKRQAMTKNPRLEVAGVTEFGASDDGNVCFVRVETHDGQRMDLVFRSSGAHAFADRIMAARDAASGRTEDSPLAGGSPAGGKPAPALLVSDHSVVPSHDASLALVALVSGERTISLGLPLHLSARLRADLEATERRMAAQQGAAG